MNACQTYVIGVDVSITTTKIALLGSIAKALYVMNPNSLTQVFKHFLFFFEKACCDGSRFLQKCENKFHSCTGGDGQRRWAAKASNGNGIG